jgi:hypothetical protein
MTPMIYITVRTRVFTKRGVGAFARAPPQCVELCEIAKTRPLLPRLVQKFKKVVVAFVAESFHHITQAREGGGKGGRSSLPSLPLDGEERRGGDVVAGGARGARLGGAVRGGSGAGG